MAKVKLCIHPITDKFIRVVAVPSEEWSRVSHYYNEEQGFSVEEHTAEQVTSEIARRWPEYSVRYQNPHNGNDCIIMR